jgi:hypothetical protein
MRSIRYTINGWIGAAAQPIGDKSPHHRFFFHLQKSGLPPSGITPPVFRLRYISNFPANPLKSLVYRAASRQKKVGLQIAYGSAVQRWAANVRHAEERVWTSTFMWQ